MDDEELEAVVRRVLEAFDPFLTAWEAKDPWVSEGERLYYELKRALEKRESERDA